MLRALIFGVLIAVATSADARQATPAPTAEDLSILAFLQAVETSVSLTDRTAWLDLLSTNANRDAAIEFFDSMVPPGVTRAVVRERDRSSLMGALPGDGYRLVADVFTEMGGRGRITTWSLDIRRPRDSTERQPWRLIGQDKLSAVEGLHRLSLHPQKQFTARDLSIKSVDFELKLPAGEVFVAETTEGVTALVLIGDGTMSFAPAPAEERGQVRLFAGADTIETPFSAAYLRLNPFEFEQQLKGPTLTPATPDTRALRRAQVVFDEEVGKSFSLNLQDLSRDNWSLLPQAGDFLAEVRTRRFGTLTFARSAGEAEDVTLFHRARKKNVSAYASETKLSSRGRFFNEDDLVEYDVVDYNIDATFYPEREWMEGRAKVKIRVKAYAIAALTLKLAEELTVQSLSSDELGRLMFLRVRHQDNVIVNLPSPVARDLELNLNITYAGRVRRQAIEEESIGVQAGGGRNSQERADVPYIPAEPHWLFSSRSHWYPQNQVSDYATATIRFTVPGDHAVVASGVLASGAPLLAAPAAVGQLRRATYIFTASQPVRYLGAVVSRFVRVDTATVALDIVPPPAPLAKELVVDGAPGMLVPALGSRNTVTLAIEANRRQQDRGRDIVGTAADILRLYAATVGDVPYDAMTIAMVEDDRPGGHSPGYFAMLNNPSPVTPFLFRNDPAVFTTFPEFYIAHEIAHQWWGQAVGWKNYHEQWLSEGFAQYFAALYARERRGEPTFREVLRQFRRWAMDQSDQGAVYLGYRLGHIKSDSRVFRALVYNKGASVLHMLRRLIGDDAFFKGVRRYYADNRFRKAGTEDLQRAMEAEAGRSLERFFERWIYQSGLPRVRYSTAVEGPELVVRFEQIGDVYDVPVTVTLHYGEKAVEEVVMLTEGTVEKRIALTGALRNVEINADHAALGTFDKR
ncbi:MAG TPA: M1 family aminopeptidase [Vicinamibacterales bacterium]|nr:M1 family aminopeptidase [Vicinamibacterales bacterium]